MLDSRNPFEFGRELDDTELVDRDSELAAIERAIRNRGKLFLIGPRRYGKTSILSAVEKRLERKGTVVLRFDAEAYESLELLAQAMLSGAASKLTSTVAKATSAVGKFFAALRPEVSFDMTAEKIKVSISPKGSEAAREVPTLTQVLSGINAMAKGHSKPVAIILDEFQQIVLEGGVSAEKQLRAEVQTHANVAYVFAGSKTRLLAEMTGDPSRAFWKLGERHFLGPIPRMDFVTFIKRGFERAGHKVAPGTPEALLDVAKDVPYNVQRLAYVAWELMRTSAKSTFDASVVDRALATLIRQEHPAYAQLWASLTKIQKRVLKAVIVERGRGLTAKDILERYDVGSSTMHKTLKLLDEKGIIREHEGTRELLYRLEDPFLGAWLRAAQDL